ncbi:MAG: ABC transporter ATP-binding protein [Promethearchaeota archaeon]
MKTNISNSVAINKSEELNDQLLESSENMVYIQNLTKYFETIHAVDEISFNIKPGEIFGLLGPNGAGKTTTVKMLLGLLEKTKGKISVFGKNPEVDNVAIKQQVGYVSEEPLIYKSLTPKELFNFISSVRNLNGKDVSKRLQEYMESLNAVQYYNKLITTLSRGNKQKIQIIAALIHNPKLLIMDEPLAGLDAKAVKVIKKILEIHTERGGSVLFSTHIMEIAEDICDRIAIINNGKIVAMGTVEELRTSAKMADQDSDLEDIFLRLTEQDESVNNIIERLRQNLEN